MKTETKTVHLNASQKKVFGFLSNIENLPQWATTFCRELKREGSDYKVINPGGELYFSILADGATGVLDMMSGPEKAQMETWPARVMAMPDQTSLFAFTCVKCPSISDESFAQQCAGVDHELEGLRRMFA